MSKKKNGSGRFLLSAIVIGAAGLIWAQQTGKIFSSEAGVKIEGAPVRKGTLEITVTEKGNLKAKNSASMKSEVEGRSTILYLIPEGTEVEPGDLVAEMDAAELVDRRVGQEITVETAIAAKIKAEKSYDIQEIENKSMIANAELNLEFAEIDLRMFLGGQAFDGETVSGPDPIALLTEKGIPGFVGFLKDEVEQGRRPFGEGDRYQQLMQAIESINIAELELSRAKEALDFSVELCAKGFISDTELQGDELAYNKAEIAREQARRGLYLRVMYEQPKEVARLGGAVAEAKLQLEKAQGQALVQIADNLAAKNSTVVKLKLEEEKLAKYEQQIAKARILAPVAGMIVYGRTEGHRWGGGEPVQEGGEVRERQEIATIPGSGGMIVEASIHESVLGQVVPGQPVLITVDALAGREFLGKVQYVSQLPDKNSMWANPNQRLYRTDITIGEGADDMRPGMSCSIEILVDVVEDTLYVPLQSVFNSGGRNISWVQNGSEPEERTVEIGQHNEKWVAINSGLREGEIVLLSPPPGYEPEEFEGGEEPGNPRLGMPEGVVLPGRGPDAGSQLGGLPGGAMGASGQGTPGMGEGRRSSDAGTPGSGEGRRGRGEGTQGGGEGRRGRGEGTPGGGEGRPSAEDIERMRKAREEGGGERPSRGDRSSRGDRGAGGQ